MFRVIKSAFVLLLICSCRNIVKPVKVQAQDTTVRILIWGLPDLDQRRVMFAEAKKYGFEYCTIGGCVISKKLSDSAFEVNRKSIEILNKRLGPGWRMEIGRKISLVKDSIFLEQLMENRAKAEVIGADGKRIEYSKETPPPPPPKETQE